MAHKTTREPTRQEPVEVTPLRAPASTGSWTAWPLLHAATQNALFTRNLAKTVEAHHSIDDMETDRGWVPTDAVELTYTTERCRSGTRSLRFAFDQRNEEYLRATRRPNGSFTGDGVIFDVAPFAAAARLVFEEPQDWTGFTRISCWCYVHPTGNRANALALQFTSAGAPSGPSDPIAINYFADMEEGEWNHLAWEIPEMRRDNVVDLSFFYPSTGLNFPNAASRLILDIDDIRVERVVTEPVEGWEIAPGKLAYSHVGYAAAGEKIAVGREEVTGFRLIDTDSGRLAAELPAASAESRTGSHSVLDFSAFTTPGRYRIEAGSTRSEPFTISARPFTRLIEATLNGIFAMRCGFAIPGVHDACHLDHFVSYDGQLRVQAGGWHDAANLSQDPNNTNITVCALLDLAEALEPFEPDLAARALEEAEWGLEWILRMRFGPGIRYLQAEQSYYTDGVVGTIDDIVDENVGSDTFKNLSAALAEVRGARALRSRDPELAEQLLRAAEEDFETVIRDRPSAPVETGEPDWTVASWQNEVGYMALVATELWRAGRDHYADEAVRLGRLLTDVQELSFVDGAHVTGYFYEDAARSRIAHEAQRTSGAPHSFEDGGLLAYQALCEAFPDHPDWINWYAGLVAYSEFFCRKGSEASSPFGLIPAAVWRESEIEGPISPDKNAEALSRHANALFPSFPTPELIRSQLRELYQAGAYLSPGQRLRTFPIYSDRVRHGSTAVHLTKAIGLGAAAHVRNRPELSQLLARQVHWVVGANPFSRSLVYGVGYDWWQNFTVSLPNFVGGLSVGMNNYRGDAPAWGNNAVFPYKEVWIVSMARLAAVLARVPGGGVIAGEATVGAELTHHTTGAVTRLMAGEFRVTLEPGEYDVTFGTARRSLSVADGARLAVDFDPARTVEIALDEVERNGVRSVRVSVAGAGEHSIRFRSTNLALTDSSHAISLGGKGTSLIEVPLDIIDPATFWVLVVAPDSDGNASAEIFGTAAPSA